MTSSTIVSALRKLAVGVVAFGAAMLTLTSGPRSVQGLSTTAEAEAATPAVTNPESVSVATDTDDPPEVLWQVLAGLDYTSGTMSDELAEFVGKEVKVPGFMLPLEDWAETASEFLLVPYVGACVHTPPPPPNQLVYIEMEGAEAVPVSFWDPVWIHGTLEVQETTNIYGSVSFRMIGTSVEPYEW